MLHLLNRRTSSIGDWGGGLDGLGWTDGRGELDGLDGRTGRTGRRGGSVFYM